MNYDSSYTTNYPTCTDCGIVRRAREMVDGRCASCRSPKFHIPEIVWWVIAVISVAVLISCAEAPTDGKPGNEDGLTWLKCYSHGDWLDTPFCDAAARGMKDV